MWLYFMVASRPFLYRWNNSYGRGKVYYLNLDYDSILKEVDESNLSEDEIKIIDYINENGSINNQQSRDTLAFSKDKNIFAL